MKIKYGLLEKKKTYYQDSILNDSIVWLIITLVFKAILFVKFTLA